MSELKQLAGAAHSRGPPYRVGCGSRLFADGRFQYWCTSEHGICRLAVGWHMRLPVFPGMQWVCMQTLVKQRFVNLVNLFHKCVDITISDSLAFH